MQVSRNWSRSDLPCETIIKCVDSAGWNALTPAVPMIESPRTRLTDFGMANASREVSWAEEFAPILAVIWRASRANGSVSL